MEAVIERITEEIESLVGNDKSSDSAETLYQLYKKNISKKDFENIYFFVVHKNEEEQTKRIKKMLSDGNIKYANRLHTTAPGKLTNGRFFE